MPSSSFPRSQGRVVNDLAAAQQLNILQIVRNAFERGIDATVAETAKDAQRFVNSLNQYKSGKGGSRSLQSANQRVMDAAQIAVLESYDERVTNAEDRFAPYRIGENRFSGGRLRRALEHPDMFASSYQGFAFINTRVLNREAAHWARLNWGAGEIASSGPYQPVSAKIVIFGQQIGPITPPSFPQAGFLMPRGRFVAKGTTWRGREPGFYPLSSVPTIQTHGIAARRFFDAAYKTIAERLPIEYDALLREWVDQAGQTSFKGLGARAAAHALSGGIAGIVGGGSSASSYNAA